MTATGQTSKRRWSPSSNGTGKITLAELAAAKCLPVEFLRELGLHDLSGGGVGIPYYDLAGETIATKRRTALKAKDGSYWPRGTPLAAYGAWRLNAAQRPRFLVLVEGESDCWALWHHGLPALGIPGANAAKTLEAEHLEGVQAIYISREPDRGGAALVSGVLNRLAELEYAGKVFQLRMPDGIKDPADLHANDPSEFLPRFEAAIKSSEPLFLPGDASEGPQRSGDDGAVDAKPWPDLVPLGEVRDVLPFPVEVFPKSVQAFVAEAAIALPCPPDYLGLPVLAMASGAIGASRRLAIKDSYTQGATVYAAVVGPPGSAKSPALEMVVESTNDAEERFHETWEQQMEKYEVEIKKYEVAVKAQKNKGEELPAKPKRPILQRLTVNDATAESLVPILKENPRGVVLVRDELIGWVQSMNQYREGGKGADQQFWLSAWSNSTVSVDRKKTHDLGPLRVRRPFISVVGGLTPEKLNTLRGDRPRQRAEQDGFIDRVLMAYPPEPPVAAENWMEMAEPTINSFRAVLDKLRTLSMVPVQDGPVIKGWRPFVVKLTHDGKQAWQRFTEAHADERNAEAFSAHLIGPWSKLRGYCARLALIVHFLRWAGGEVDFEDVDGESMDRAAKLVAYFKSHTRKVYAVMDADPRIADARKVIRWIGKGHLEHFSKRDAYQALKGTFQTVEKLEPVLDLLERYGAIRPGPTAERSGPGRKSSPHYEVHPRLLSTDPHNSHNPQN